MISTVDNDVQNFVNDVVQMLYFCENNKELIDCNERWKMPIYSPIFYISVKSKEKILCSQNTLLTYCDKDWNVESNQLLPMKIRLKKKTLLTVKNKLKKDLVFDYLS